MIEYLIFGIIVIFTIYVIYSNIKKKIKGIGSCEHSCKNCPNKCSTKNKNIT